MKAEIDPVCGMAIDDQEGAERSSYEGKTYYFCSDECKDAWEADPQKYVNASDSAAMGTGRPSRR